jgi:hypothetical protein
MSRPSFPSTINDDRQLDLVEFLETASPRPFRLWRDDTGRREVVPDGDIRRHSARCRARSKPSFRTGTTEASPAGRFAQMNIAPPPAGSFHLSDGVFNELALALPLVDALTRLEQDMVDGKWSFGLVSARSDALMAIAQAVEQMGYVVCPAASSTA